MNAKQTTVRVDATYDVRVRAGDRITPGDRLSDAPEAQTVAAPISGVVESVDFDPGNHEFVIVITHTP
jgi:hypothetical protein